MRLWRAWNFLFLFWSCQIGLWRPWWKVDDDEPRDFFVQKKKRASDDFPCLKIKVAIFFCWVTRLNWRSSGPNSFFVSPSNVTIFKSKFSSSLNSLVPGRRQRVNTEVVAFIMLLYIVAGPCICLAASLNRFFSIPLRMYFKYRVKKRKEAAAAVCKVFPLRVEKKTWTCATSRHTGYIWDVFFFVLCVLIFFWEREGSFLFYKVV